MRTERWLLFNNRAFDRVYEQTTVIRYNLIQNVSCVASLSFSLSLSASHCVCVWLLLCIVHDTRTEPACVMRKFFGEFVIIIVTVCCVVVVAAHSSQLWIEWPEKRTMKIDLKIIQRLHTHTRHHLWVYYRLRVNEEKKVLCSAALHEDTIYAECVYYSEADMCGLELQQQCTLY